MIFATTLELKQNNLLVTPRDTLISFQKSWSYKIDFAVKGG